MADTSKYLAETAGMTAAERRCHLAYCAAWDEAKEKGMTDDEAHALADVAFKAEDLKNLEGLLGGH